MTAVDKLVLVGAGGHGKVVISTLRACGKKVIAIYDDDPATWKTALLGVPVTGPIQRILKDGFRSGVMGIGNNRIRRRLAETLSLQWRNVVHPHAWVAEDIFLGAGTVVFAGSIIQTGTVLGRHVIVNTGATVDHDCTVGDYAHIAPGVHLCGGVTLGEGAMLGVGSSVVPGIRIGPWATVGAGATVIRNVKANQCVVGVPARAKEKGQTS